MCAGAKQQLTLREAKSIVQKSFAKVNPDSSTEIARIAFGIKTLERLFKTCPSTIDFLPELQEPRGKDATYKEYALILALAVRKIVRHLNDKKLQGILKMLGDGARTKFGMSGSQWDYGREALLFAIEQCLTQYTATGEVVYGYTGEVKLAWEIVTGVVISELKQSQSKLLKLQSSKKFGPVKRSSRGPSKGLFVAAAIAGMCVKTLQRRS